MSTKNRRLITDEFLAALADEFAEHGRPALARVRDQDPAKFLELAARLLPKEVDVAISASEARLHAIPDHQLDAMIARLQRQVASDNAILIEHKS